MNPTLDPFILSIPHLFLKQYLYTWFPLAVLWTGDLNISLVFVAVIVIGTLSLRWQSAAWLAYMRCEHAGKEGKLGLSFWQLFLIFVGFTLTYQDIRFFGFPTIYIITAAGIAVYFAPRDIESFLGQLPYGYK